MVKSIVKRDGRVVLYDENKITAAILKSLKAAGEGDAEQAEQVAHAVGKRLDALPQENPRIEEIQDIAEQELMHAGFENAAKQYILYRAERTRIREAKTSLMHAIDEITNVDARQSDMKRDNANIDGNTAMGSMLQIGTAGAKAYNAAYLLTPEQSKAYAEGDIHIHDFDFYALTTTCCQIDLLRLFKGGFSTGHGYLREPQSIGSYAALAAIAIQSNQNDQHGGQGVPNFDCAMAQGVAKSFARLYRRKLRDALEDVLDSEDETELARQATEAGEEATGHPARLEIDAERFDEAVCAALVGTGRLDEKAAASIVRRARRRAAESTDRDTFQAMEGFVHNLNTMHSRAGAQTPFSSINYGTDTSPEGRMVIRNILLAEDAGLGHGETPIFPIHIFKVKEGVNYNPGDPNYDLFQLSCRVSAKRLFPNYVFLDSPFNLQYYRPGHPETEVATMGCRTRVMGNFYDPEREIAYSRGNLSFTSINLPRLAIESKGDEALFYEKLDAMMEMVAQQLLDRFEIQASKRVYNYPFLMGQGVWLDSDRLGPNDEVREVLKHGSLSIGFIGLAETLTALYGHHHGESEEMQEKGLQIIGHMREFCDRRGKEMGLNFGLLATPAEGLSGRFLRMDQKRYGIIPGVTDREYYTNSFHIPVWYEISAYDKINKEAPYHALTNAGHISYVELDGDTANNVEAFEAVVRCMHDAGIGYGSINHPVDRDPVCGYVGVIGEVCPRCGRREGEELSPERIAELKKLYPEVTAFCGCE
ncbi:MAG TPA: anaerobic ribonucleoside triphosphate reductase [Candidatus Ruthenibacterium merdavium]|uniref:Anaerobic ribonucleoside triphosphate reductase n=1 Tax=Candidatus Ruthenibacterium merdavium TaxID=2838752 RepID=A0A9D2Q5I1_9FIRM|nr:anaerobic ribonucleoside triphosphate reductase [Candidatus Ruthenibacterium merdavium]